MSSGPAGRAPAGRTGGAPGHRPEPRTTGIVAALLLVTAVSLLLIGVSGGLQRDVTTATGLAAEREPTPVAFALLVTEIGNTVGSALVALVAGGVLYWRGRRAEGVCLAAVPLVASAVMSGLKRVLDRSRPPEQLQVLSVANESLPSGHATMVAAAWTALVLVLWPSLTRRVRTLLAVFAALWAGAVGFTRIYLGVHWLSDVLAGWALGAGLAFAGVTVLSVVQAGRRPTGVT
ncbi:MULTISPECIES: phosphatase PAP2 family protein [unclassified Pseudonocardia]|uniref:phosphatase PAP2 family protein n=1 Tax=unclassified Pseudonocardia TaxID=2619320 RepID=UPI0007613F42|nr:MULTISPECIES: phosphatase PAP2 family protein [unclassified Pseudonocardia]